MKNVFLYILLLTLIFSEAHGQLLTKDSIDSSKKYLFLKNDKAINLSIEFINRFDFSLNQIGINLSAHAPAIQLEYEYGIEDELSLAGLFYYNNLTVEIPFYFTDIINLNSNSNTEVLESLVSSQNCQIDPDNCSASIKKRVIVYTIGGKLKYHKSVIKNLDTYASINFGYSIIKRKTTIDPLIKDFISEEVVDIKVNRFTYFIGSGVRYFFISNLGIWGEFGFGNIYRLNIGLSYKL